MVYVSHDLGAIARVSDRVIVMYSGEIVLDGPVRGILKNPIHPTEVFSSFFWAHRWK